MSYAEDDTYFRVRLEKKIDTGKNLDACTLQCTKIYCCIASYEYLTYKEAIEDVDTASNQVRQRLAGPVRSESVV